MVGLAEEFAFRGYLLTTLSEGIGFWPALDRALAGFRRSSYGKSRRNPIGLLTVVIVGMFFCLTVRRTGSLWFAVGAHSAFDFGQAFVYSVPNSGTLIRDPLFTSSLRAQTGSLAEPRARKAAFSRWWCWRCCSFFSPDYIVLSKISASVGLIAGPAQACTVPLLSFDSRFELRFRQCTISYLRFLGPNSCEPALKPLSICGDKGNPVCA